MNSWKQSCSQTSCTFQIPSFAHCSGSLDEHCRLLVLALPAGFCKTQHDDKKQEPKEVSGKHIRGGGKKIKQNRRDKKRNGAESERGRWSLKKTLQKRNPPTHTPSHTSIYKLWRAIKAFRDRFHCLNVTQRKTQAQAVKAWKKIALCGWTWMKTGWLTSRNTYSMIMGCFIAMATHLLMC